MASAPVSPVNDLQKRPRSRKSIAHLPSPSIDNNAIDKENTVANVATALDVRPAIAKAQVTNKRSRSKSIGPGGLDALREDAGNRRKAAAVAAPKSILKPFVPLSPLKEIPIRKFVGAAKPFKSPPKSPSTSPRKAASSPQKAMRAPSPASASPGIASGSYLSGPASPTSRIFDPATFNDVTSEPLIEPKDGQEEQRKTRDDILKQRDLRRKSMANRRVSFAPEATLHTWDMVEENQDSTTSSASTNFTRRASAVSNASSLTSPKGPTRPSTTTPDGEDLPSTPPMEDEDVIVPESPANQRGLHQKKGRRRSSVIPPMNFNNPEDSLSSSPSSGDSEAESDDTVTQNGIQHARIGPSAGSFLAPKTMSPINDASRLSPAPGSPSKLHNRERAERQINDKARLAELGEVTMELVDDEITGALKPWAKHVLLAGQSVPNLPFTQNQEDINPFSPAFKKSIGVLRTHSPARSQQDDGDMSMEMTRVVGSIVQTSNEASKIERRPAESVNQRQSVRSRRRSSGGGSIGDGTMEFTTAIGGIQPDVDISVENARIDSNEELSMELTTMFGSISNRNGHKSEQQLATDLAKVPQLLPRISEAMESLNDDEADMDLTTAIGTIGHPRIYDDSLQGDGDLNMDLTRADGLILPLEVGQTFQSLLATETDGAVGGTESATSQLRWKADGPHPLASESIVESTGATEKRARGRPRKSHGGTHTVTPVATPQTPSKQVRSVASRPTTPAKSSPVKDITPKVLSAKRLFREESDQTKTRCVIARSELFHSSAMMGHQNTTSLLGPKALLERRVSGVGFDREGLGSPRVAMLLDRRGSIGEKADIFMPTTYASREVRFDDPKALGAEVLKEREDDERRESRQFILEKEAGAELDEKDITATLREAIESMTPKKKKKLKGRKSLAVGAAKGLLGTRPAELDESDEDRTPMSLKGRQGSSVRKVELQSAALALKSFEDVAKRRRSLAETTANSQTHTPTLHFPFNGQSITTPKSQGRFKDTQALPSASQPLPTLGQENLDEGVIHLNKDNEEENFHLQDFLNLTSIRFIELNTTKRRHTVVPSGDRNTIDIDGTEGGNSGISQQFEDSVVAGACTIPMLELYQHSCRELKKYITEGRGVIREIEAETFQDNPPLFREYMSASPADRAVMDNQFKNMKTHARLLSKGMWYEWRMKLIEGLKVGLASNAEGLNSDNVLLGEQERAIEPILTALLDEHTRLQSECEMLQARADELASYNQEELRLARQQLLKFDDEINTKRQMMKDSRREVQEIEATIEQIQDMKVECLHSIREAQKVREEYRGWSSTEVGDLKDKVDDMEAKHGWTILSAASTTITLTYHHQLQMFFDVAAFMTTASPAESSNRANAPISLTYIADTDEHRPVPLTTEKRFFLQLMRAHLQCLSQHNTPIGELLRFVSEGWTTAVAVAEQVRGLDFEFLTDCNIISDERFAVNVVVLLPNVKTKVRIGFEVGAAAKGMDIEAALKVNAEVVYGEKYKEDKMGEFLASRVGLGLEGTTDGWVDAVRELKKRLVATGRKT